MAPPRWIHFLNRLSNPPNEFLNQRLGICEATNFMRSINCSRERFNSEIEAIIF